MMNGILRKIKKKIRKQYNVREIDPDEILIDAKNLPEFNTDQFEGRIEKPVSFKTILFLAGVIILLIFAIIYRAYDLEIKNGETYEAQSNQNRLSAETIFADRGAIFDRNGVRLASNTVDPEEKDFAARSYTTLDGLGLLLGYVKYPAKDSHGIYYRKNFQGTDGVEKFYNDILAGENGKKLTEMDAAGAVTSEYLTEPAKNGENVHLSIDSRLQSELYDSIKNLAEKIGFTGGAGAIMDVTNGEIIALTSFPEYESSVMTSGKDAKNIKSYLKNPNLPFLNRMTNGLYTPGSIVKPFLALAALKENVIDPDKNIYTKGFLSIPNPYDPLNPTIFKDWKNHGYVDMRKALAVSSDVYFYIVGGGFQDISGLGIEKMNKYFKEVGLGNWMGQGIFSGQKGTVPSPSWKEKAFPNDPWRIGDTYLTAIGQYGFQVTPLQMLRAIGAVANGGKLFEPQIIKRGALGSNATTYESLPFSQDEYKIVRQGMREGVTNGGTSAGLNVPYVSIAGKTGTAQLGTLKQYVNSWATGFFPYENPHYAYIVLMEHGPSANTLGGIYVMRNLIDWMTVNAPEYFNP